MATTTTYIHAKDANLYIGGVSIQGSSNYVAFRPTKEVGDAMVFGDDWAYSVAGIKRWDGEIRVLYTETASEGFKTLQTAYESMSAVAFVVIPKGSTASNLKWTGSIHITGAPVELDRTATGAVVVSCPFTGTGAATMGTV